MKIIITKKNIFSDRFDYELSSDYPAVTCKTNAPDAAFRCIKQDCLGIIREWIDVPDTIEFVYRDAPLEKNRVPKQAWRDYVADDVPAQDPFVNKLGGVYNYI